MSNFTTTGSGISEPPAPVPSLLFPLTWLVPHTWLEIYTLYPNCQNSNPTQFIRNITYHLTTLITIYLTQTRFHGMEVDLSQPRPHCVRQGPSSFPPLAKEAQQPARFSAHVYCGHGCPSQLLLSSCNNSFKADYAVNL